MEPLHIDCQQGEGAHPTQLRGDRPADFIVIESEPTQRGEQAELRWHRCAQPVVRERNGGGMSEPTKLAGQGARDSIGGRREDEWEPTEAASNQVLNRAIG